MLFLDHWPTYGTGQDSPEPVCTGWGPLLEKDQVRGTCVHTYVRTYMYAVLAIAFESCLGVLKLDQKT